MTFYLNDIKFGNPTIQQIYLMSKQTYLDSLYDKISEFLPPENDSDITQKEINDIMNELASLQNNENDGMRYLHYDLDLVDYYKRAALKVGMDVIEVEKKIIDILDETAPILMRLKYKHNRPRPFQLSHYYQVKLFPFETISSQSPSYPSMTSYFSRIISEVLGNLHPNYYKPFKKLSDDICLSRVKLGVHYNSDIEAGIFCAEEVIANKEFKKRHSL